MFGSTEVETLVRMYNEKAEFIEAHKNSEKGSLTAKLVQKDIDQCSKLYTQLERLGHSDMVEPIESVEFQLPEHKIVSLKLPYGKAKLFDQWWESKGKESFDKFTNHINN